MSTGGQSILLIFCGPLLILVAALLQKDRKQRSTDVFVGGGFALFIVLASMAHIWLIKNASVTIDELLMRADHAIGLDPLKAAFLIHRHPWLLALSSLAYAGLSIAIGLTWVIERNFRMLASVALGGIVCFAIYILFPAVGPGWYDWNAHIAAQVPRNCMPSMHLTWALLLAMTARGKWLRNLLWVNAILVTIATLGLAQHYYIDLLAAIPYTFSILAIYDAPATIRGMRELNGIR